MKGVREGEGTSNGDTNSSLSISGSGPTGRHLLIGVSMDGVTLCHSIVLFTVSKLQERVERARVGDQVQF